MGCSTSADNEKLKQIASEKLSSQYNVKILKGINPRIRIAAISDKLSAEEIAEYAVKMNPFFFESSFECNVISVTPLKKNNHLYQAVLQIDRKSYNRIISAGYLFIGYDCCKVYDAISVLRCFNCNGFNHSAKQCSRPTTCPRCGANHKVTDCTENDIKCVNCLASKAANPNHAAWDVNCPVYMEAADKIRKDLLTIQ